MSAEFQTAAPGERWGGFVFSGPTVSASSLGTRAARAADVEGAEGIPFAHDGLVRAALPARLRKAVPAPFTCMVPSALPPGYRLLGSYLIDDPKHGVVDYAVCYDKTGTSTVERPDLWVTWTDRAPLPLSARSESLDIGLGRLGLPLVKVTVRGLEGVFQEWQNPNDLDDSLRIPASLNWFEPSGRLWAVQAHEALETLLSVAESLTDVG